MSRFHQILLVVSYLEVCFPQKPVVPKNIGGSLKGSQLQLWEDYLFVQYDNNNNSNLLLSPLPIKLLNKVSKVLRSLVAPVIIQDVFLNAWNLFAHH